MLCIDIPPNDPIYIEHVILDFNGTIATDGQLIAGVVERIAELSSQVTIHIITADTNASARTQLHDVPCTLKIIGANQQDRAKLEYAQNLGANTVLAVGNGRNDGLLLQEATLGICVIQREGASVQAMQAADLVCIHINDALDLLLRPHRLKATLRNG